MQKNFRISFIKFIFIIYVIILIFLSLSYTLLLMKKSGSNSDEIENYGQKYGNTQFVKYDNQISIPVPSGGRYFLENVDVDSFRVLDLQDYSDRSTLIVGLDKNSVYFGNIRIPDLDPNKLKVIGNGYYTDGINTYYCSDMSERNKNLSSLMEIFQTLIYAFSKTKRPQSYIYPYKKVETDKRLQAVANLSFFASDGDKIYYKGEVLENVDLNTLVPIDGQYTYFADKESVYYKSKLLPIKNSGNLKVVSLNPDDKFLYDEVNGYVFIGDYSFDREKAPYKIIGSNGTHLYSLIFVSDDGIYFYNTEKKKQEKLKDNIFIGDIEEISPNVFTDNKNIYYFQNYEILKKPKNRGNILVSRNTEVYSLGKKESWKKLADIGNENIGSIWQKDSEYYYFDNLENFSSTRDYRSTIYKITDKSTLESLLSYPEYINAEKIDEFILNKNFQDVKGEKLFTATIKFHNVLKIFLGVLLVLGFIFIVFFLYLNKLNKEDKKNIDKMLLEKYRNIKPISKDYNNKE
ncbi:DKNYY domain-containing protein [Fusobacterium polymorphum]|uniref:DKNYY domain-containing protein n=1 Tax=Fusobacterium nucleatum subsp. polymorphum TaxID=76857 RepID=UPI00300AE32B